MNSRTRISKAMQLLEPDRVPLMCQLSLGHYFLHSGLDPVEIWCGSEAFAEALVKLARRYSFDGILVNLPGRPPDWIRRVDSVERGEEEIVVKWKGCGYTVFPRDDNPKYHGLDPARQVPIFAALDPDQLGYVEPWSLTGMPYPYSWEFEESEADRDSFPPYQLASLQRVLSMVQGSLSVHAEVFSPWSQFLELLDYQQALLAIMDDPGKVKGCLDRLADGAVALGCLEASLDIDAILISSAFAGGSFISRDHYQEFVLPFEKKVVRGIKACRSLPVYTHTCGMIGDRLDLMLASGTDGVDTLDPPPLGTVKLEEAKRLLQGKAFIKGNINPVDTLLKGTVEQVRRDARHRLEIAKPGGGYILSSACSVAPATPPENIEVLDEVVESWGYY
jgi:hypothetical protein